MLYPLSYEGSGVSVPGGGSGFGWWGCHSVGLGACTLG